MKSDHLRDCLLVLSFLNSIFGEKLFTSTTEAAEPEEEPEFVGTIENATVPIGRNMKMACTVKNLGSYKVAWMHFEQSAILTVNSHVITRNSRITVTHDKHTTWYLHISNVQEGDKGRYMCQLNTISAKTQYAYLYVVVPPLIDDSLSSSDIIAREGANVTLNCHATGAPAPVIKWRRDDGADIALNKTYSVSEWEGSQVSLVRISRLDMGAYLCIASNNVPPSVSKRIKVNVDFPPQLLIPHQLVSVIPSSNATLECYTEAHPSSLNYWTRGDNHMLHDNRKYRTENIAGSMPFKIHMRLTILHVGKDDFGVYKCVAKNPRGETEGVIRIYASEQETSTQAQSIASSTFKNSFDTDVGKMSEEESVFHDTGKRRKKLNSNMNEIDRSEQIFGHSGNYNWKTGKKNVGTGLRAQIRMDVMTLMFSWMYIVRVP